MDHNIVYVYDYYLIVGTVNQIRSYVYKHADKGGKPDYRFEGDREHWWFVNATDAGLPVKGGLRLEGEAGEDPQVFSPYVFWHAKDVPKLYIDRVHRDPRQDRALYWRILQDAIPPDQWRRVSDPRRRRRSHLRNRSRRQPVADRARSRKSGLPCHPGKPRRLRRLTVHLFQGPSAGADQRRQRHREGPEPGSDNGRALCRPVAAWAYGSQHVAFAVPQSREPLR